MITFQNSLTDIAERLEALNIADTVTPGRRVLSVLTEHTAHQSYRVTALVEVSGKRYHDVYRYNRQEGLVWESLNPAS